MTKDVLVDATLGVIRIAVLEDGELAEFHMEGPEDECPLGNIYRGKVERVLPGMQSAFIDIGLPKNAFLQMGDVMPGMYASSRTSKDSTAKPPAIEEVLKAGQELTVQVIKDMPGKKGPRVTTRISLPGRFAVLLPGQHVTGVSRRVEDDSERSRLKELAAMLRPEGSGIIFRTAAAYVPDEVLKEEIDDLVRKWDEISKKQEKGPVPRCLFSEPDFVSRVIREHMTADLNRIIVNDRELWHKILQFLESVPAAHRPKAEYFDREYDMFEYYHVESALNSALSRKVLLKSGGFLVFDITEALTVIDVNSGRYVGRESLEDTALKVNMEAAAMIARQIRLRNISGIIVIDFIDMNEESHREEVLSVLREAVKRDRTQTVVVGMTGLGLVEMTRKKVRQPLAGYMTVPCRFCGGAGRIVSPETVALKLIKRILGYIPHARSGHLEVTVHPEVYKVLKAKMAAINDRNRTCGVRLELVTSDDVPYGDMRLREMQ